MLGVCMSVLEAYIPYIPVIERNKDYGKKSKVNK